MKYVILSICMCFCYAVYGQAIQKDTTQSRCNLGIYPNIYFIDQLVDDQSSEFARIFSCELRPYLTYRLYRNLYLGCNFSYEFFDSNFYKKDHFIEIGLFSRYIIPYTINKWALKRMHVYIEAGYYKTNYKTVAYVANTFEYKGVKIEEDFVTSKKMNQNKISIPIGLTIQVTKQTYIDLNWQYIKFINGARKNGFMCGVGFTFE